MERPLVSIIIASYNGEDYLPACIASVAESQYTHYEVIVVDNGSGNRFQQVSKTLPAWVRQFRLDTNTGFSAGNNYGAAHAQGQYLVFLNDDTFVEPNWLDAIIQHFDTQPQVGVIGAKIFNLEDRTTLQHAGGVLTDEAFAFHRGSGQPDSNEYNHPLEVEYVTGACLACRRKVYDEIGGLEESYHPLYFEDVEFCWRAHRAGWRVVYDPAVVIYHKSMRTSSALSQRYFYRFHKNRIRFVLRNFSRTQVRRWCRLELLWILCGRYPNQILAVFRAYAVMLPAVPKIWRERKIRQLHSNSPTVP